MPEQVAMKRQQALSVRQALERLSGNEELPQWQVAKVKSVPEVCVAEIIADLADRVLKLETISNKHSLRITKLEKRIEELEAAKKPRSTRKKKVEE
jgi:hypothetical protein